ncbi:MAG: hypothetical protein IT456_25555 [Planctomycetes bacterium]|nr:hypothetical protein [Planctomycetota bacterium]
MSAPVACTCLIDDEIIDMRDCPVHDAPCRRCGDMGLVYERCADDSWAAFDCPDCFPR